MTSIEMELVIEEAQRRFPSGTVFNNSELIGMVRANQTVADPCRIKSYGSDEVIVNVAEHSTYTIYRDGIWADIISGPAGSEPTYTIY